jgi:hypothetical protein
MDAFIRGDLRLVLSELTLRELAPAPPAVREVLATVPDGHIEVVRLTPAADERQEEDAWCQVLATI